MFINGKKSSNKQNKNPSTNSNLSTNLNNSFCFSNNKQKYIDKQIIDKIISEYKSEMNQMNEYIKFNEENYLEEIKLIKSQSTNFINENINLKNINEQLLIENNFKDKEIEKYKHIIQTYQKKFGFKNNEKENISKKSLDTQINSNNNEILYKAKIEKLKADNLLLINDLKISQSENTNNKIILNQYQEKIIVYDKKIIKKNAHISKLKKQIKELKDNIKSLNSKINSQNNNNDSCNISYDFSVNSKLDNNNNSFVSSTTSAMNDNFLYHINKLFGENNFLRKELQKAKNKLYDINIQLQIYESEEEENIKNRQILQKFENKIQNLLNQKIAMINYINKQINELNQQSNKDMKLDLIKINDTYNNIKNITLNDIALFFKYIFNKIFSLYYAIDINKKKEKFYEKEIKDNEIEKKILKEQLDEKECDIQAYKETIKCYEDSIKKLNEEKRKLADIIKDMKRDKIK